MNLYERLDVISNQERAYIKGTMEFTGLQWLFFDEIDEITYSIEEMQGDVELFSNGRWQKGKPTTNGIKYPRKGIVPFCTGDEIRFRKKLTLSLEQLLEELQEPTFLLFIKSLNDLSYSIYDCIYCHNFLNLLHSRSIQKGVNTMIFDNEDQICTVHHHFNRSHTNKKDRFEFTMSNGSRTLLQNIS